MMDLTEKLIVEAHPRHAGSGPEAAVGRADESISRRRSPARPTTSFSPSTPALAGDDAAGVAKLAEQIGFDTAGKHPDVVKSFVFEERVEDRLAGPIFVIDYPASICPLTKRKAGNPAVAERFELFIQGMEVANAYTELNDPDLQEELFTHPIGGPAGRRIDGQDGPRFPPRPAARHAAGRRAGHRHRPAGDAVDQLANDSRGDFVPAAAAGGGRK